MDIDHIKNWRKLLGLYKPLTLDSFPPIGEWTAADEDRFFTIRYPKVTRSPFNTVYKKTSSWISENETTSTGEEIVNETAVYETTVYDPNYDPFDLNSTKHFKELKVYSEAVNRKVLKSELMKENRESERLAYLMSFIQNQSGLVINESEKKSLNKSDDDPAAAVTKTESENLKEKSELSKKKNAESMQSSFDKPPKNDDEVVEVKSQNLEESKNEKIETPGEDNEAETSEESDDETMTLDELKESLQVELDLFLRFRNKRELEHFKKCINVLRMPEVYEDIGEDDEMIEMFGRRYKAYMKRIRSREQDDLDDNNIFLAPEHKFLLTKLVIKHGYQMGKCETSLKALFIFQKFKELTGISLKKDEFPNFLKSMFDHGDLKYINVTSRLSFKTDQQEQEFSLPQYLLHKKEEEIKKIDDEDEELPTV